MPADQTAAELTTRDVLLQVDRRLSLIEEDLRSLDEKLDYKVDGLDAKLDHKIDGLRSEINTQIGGLRAEFNTRLHTEIGNLRSEMSGHFSRIDNKFWLQTGLILSSWISLMVALLFR